MRLMLDRSKIDHFLDAAAESLEGEWLLVGGAAAAVWFKRTRVTEDIDLIGLAGTNAERLQLIDLAEAEGLPFEAVNSAADFFVRRIEDWRRWLEPLRTGPRATIYRPSATLFLLLKCERLSETDLEDCLDLIEFVQREGTALDRRRVLDKLTNLRPSEDAALLERRRQLRNYLETNRAK